MENSFKSGRLQSLDALRGFDMFFIMGGDAFFVALGSLFPETVLSDWGRQMHHAEWHGFTAIDLVFPLFLFISGISFPLSLAKQRALGHGEARIFRKIVRRGLMLLLLGCIYNGLLQFHFDEMRYASVLGRIGLAWMFAALLTMKCGTKTLCALVPAILLGYWTLSALVPSPEANGADPYSMQGSLAGYIDRHLQPGQLYLGIHDPEGIFATLPAIATALAGVLTGKYIHSAAHSGNRKTMVLLLAAAVLGIVAWLWNPLFPVNKNLWTSSFVCLTAACSLLLFAIFYWVIDVKGCKRWSFFFTVIGQNSITIYLAQCFISFGNTARALFGGIIGLFPAVAEGVAGAAAYIATCWLFLYFLYRKRIFLKV